LDFGVRKLIMGYPSLIAKGYSSLDDVTPMYLWNCGNYKYEIEVKANKYMTSSEVFNADYYEALDRFKEKISEKTFEWISLV
jgi:hypothetical protein